MEAKLITPPEGKAVVYIVRPSHRIGIRAASIICDGKYISNINLVLIRYSYTGMDTA